MKPNQLRALLSVAEQGGIRGAARAMGLSQAAVTRALRELEAYVQVPLLERASRGTVLTDAGQVLCERARVIVREIERTRGEMAQLRDSAGGVLSISIAPMEALTILPDAYTRFRRSMPDVRLSFFEGVLSVALQKLREATLDFVTATATPERLGSEFLAEPLLTSRLTVVGRIGHPCRDACTLGELSSQEWILNNVWEGYAQVMLDAFIASGAPTPGRIIACHSFATEIGMVSGSDVITVLPAQMLDVPWIAERVEPLVSDVELPTVTKSVIMRRDVPLTNSARHFIRCLRDEYALRALAQPHLAGQPA